MSIKLIPPSEDSRTWPTTEHEAAEGYLLFTEEDLLKALSKDGRFIVEHADADLFAKIRVAGKRRARGR